MRVLRDWYERNFSNPQVVILALSLVVGFGFVILFGDILAPVLASIVIAYLLEGPVGQLERLRVPRSIAVLIVFVFFLAGFIFLLFSLIPMVLEQLTQFFQKLPDMLTQVQSALMGLPERFPNLVHEDQIRDLIGVSRDELRSLGQQMFTLSVASLVGFVKALVYVILVPFMVFFLLKDKDRILGWVGKILPKDRQLVTDVWKEVDRQIGNFLRGKSWEILIIWGVSSSIFALLGLELAVFIGLLVGLSVLIPYIGAASMTIPVALAASFQWGFGKEFLYVMIAYAVIQILDGNVLAPLLLSEVTDLHPVGIIVSILFFGGLWGFWGVFFAIPLATLVRAVIDAWPRVDRAAESRAGP